MNWAGSRTISGGLLALLLTLEPAGAADSLERWRLFSDRVMGGISTGQARQTELDGLRCLRMQGDVRLENNGGFVQVASDLELSEREAFIGGDGIELVVYGNSETYNVHLRTDGMRYPWQSYRASFLATPQWQTLRLPFAAFEPHRVEGALDSGQVRRLGVVAIGRAFTADLCIHRVGVYRD